MRATRDLESSVSALEDVMNELGVVKLVQNRSVHCLERMLIRSRNEKNITSFSEIVESELTRDSRHSSIILFRY